jgi:hypothetical protein
MPNRTAEIRDGFSELGLQFQLASSIFHDEENHTDFVEVSRAKNDNEHGLFFE